MNQLSPDLTEIAVHASSLWDGFVFGHESDELFRIWGQGGIELHYELAQLAIADVRLCYAVSDVNFPGVYTYEVTEALGQMVAAHLISTGDFPTDVEWQTALGELALTFFARGNMCNTEIAALREVVARQLPCWQAEVSDESPPANTTLIPITAPPAGGSHRPTQHSARIRPGVFLSGRRKL